MHSEFTYESAILLFRHGLKLITLVLNDVRSLNMAVPCGPLRVGRYSVGMIVNNSVKGE
jgi:hypothetical protein